MCRYQRGRLKSVDERGPDFSRAPPDTKVSTLVQEQIGCMWCAFYSQKVFIGVDVYDGPAISISGSGKCFLDYEKRGAAYYVDSNMWCPGFQKERIRP